MTADLTNVLPLGRRDRALRIDRVDQIDLAPSLQRLVRGQDHDDRNSVAIRCPGCAIRVHASPDRPPTPSRHSNRRRLSDHGLDQHPPLALTSAGAPLPARAIAAAARLVSSRQIFHADRQLAAAVAEPAT
jgi:hypothetical protein